MSFGPPASQPQLVHPAVGSAAAVNSVSIIVIIVNRNNPLYPL